MHRHRRWKRSVSLLVMICIMLSYASVLSAKESNLAGHWAEDAMTKWIEQGIIQGDANKAYHPDQAMTRAELVTFLVRILNLKEMSDQQFGDISPNAWYASAFAKAKAAGLVLGDEQGNANPHDRISREEAAVLYARVFQLSNNGDASGQRFADDDRIASWSRGAIRAMQANGYIRGKLGNQFDPKGQLSRAEAFQIFDNAIDAVIGDNDVASGDYQKSIIINGNHAVIANMKVKGNLYITVGVNAGVLTLDQLEVEGDIIIDGAGAEGIVITNSNLNGNVIVNRAQASIVANNTYIHALHVQQPEGKLHLDGRSSVNQFTAQASITITGADTIANANILASGVVLDKQPKTIAIKNGVTAQIAGRTVTNGEAASNGGSAPSTGGGTNPTGPTEPTDPVELTSSEKLKEEDSAEQNRWLSIPHSRIVVNPFDFSKPDQTTQVQYSNSPTLPLNIGYLSPWVKNYLGYSFPNVMGVADRTQALTSVNEVWTARFTESNRWRVSEFEFPEDAEVEYNEQYLKLSVNSNAAYQWQFLTSEVITIDLDNNPLLYIDAETTGNWVIKIYDYSKGDRGDERVLRPENSVDGIETIDLAKMVPDWTGDKEVILRIFQVGRGSYLKINQLKIMEIESAELAEAESYTTTWAPHELTYHANYASGLELDGSDFFYDENTVIRTIQVDQSGESKEFAIFGEYKGDIEWNDKLQTIYVSTGDTVQDQQYAISFGVDASSSILYFDSYVDIMIDSGSSEPSGRGYWLLKFALNTLPTTGLSAAFSIGTVEENKEDIIERARQPLVRGDIANKFKSRLGQWNELLAKVPVPSEFELEYVDPQGVTFEDIEREYYKAWVFIASNIVAAAPEIGYNYPQIVTGKASLWGHGDEKAAYSASWESLLQIQQYAYIDIDLAWDAFKGMMSLVNDEGLMAGESLPSRKAQTALILYNISKDAESLQEIYPALERYLLWRLDHIRWIMPGNDNPDVIDAEFAVSALKDIEFTMEISRILGYSAKIDFWEDKYEKLYERYTTTFWKDGVPYQYYDLVHDIFSPGNPLWTSTGMYLTDLDPVRLQSLYTRLKANMDYSKPFAALFIPKHPDISYLTYGLVNNGYYDDARQIIETMIRDVTKANFFAEQYAVPGTPYPQGVRPSSFGATMLIDNVLQRNGLRTDLGKPVFTNLFNKDGQVSNLILNGDKLNFRLNAAAQTIHLTGAWMSQGATTIDAPLNTIVNLPAVEEQSIQDRIISVGDQVKIELQESATYHIASSDPSVAGVALNGNELTVQGLSPGNAIVTIVAASNGYSDRIQTLDVAVSAATGWDNEQEALTAWTWNEGQLGVSKNQDGLKLNVLENSSIETTIEADAASVGLLKLVASEATASWGISLIDASSEEIVVRGISQGTGEFIYDIDELTDWTGQQSLTLRIYASGEGGSVSFQAMKMIRKPEITASIIADYAVEAYTETVIPVRTMPSRVNYEASSDHQEIAVVGMIGNRLHLNAVNPGNASISVKLSRQWYADRTLTFDVAASTPAIRVLDIPSQYVSVNASKQVDLVTMPVEVSIAPVSSDEAIVMAAFTDGKLTIAGVSEGTANVTLTLSRTGYLSVTKTFPVTVHAEGLGWKADFTDLSQWSYGYSSNPGGINVVQLDGGATGVRLTLTDVANPFWQPFYPTAKVKVNVDETPILQLHTLHSVKDWTVKIENDDLGISQALKPEDGSVGTFSFNLKDYGPMSGWTGEREFTVKIYVTGGPTASITVDQMQMVSQAYIDNHASEIAVGDILEQYVSVDSSKSVAVSAVPGDVTIASAISDAAAVAQAAVTDGKVMITGITEGHANITLTFTKPGFDTVTKTFLVNVLAKGLGWQADFTKASDWGYGYPFNPGGLEVSQLNGGTDGVRITLTNKADPAWQQFYTAVKVKVNVDETPILRIRTSAAQNNWTVKIENNHVDQALKPEDSAEGTFTYKLTDYGPMSGWTGEQEFLIRIFIIGGPGSSLTIEQMELVSQTFLDEKSNEIAANAIPSQLLLIGDTKEIPVSVVPEDVTITATSSDSAIVQAAVTGNKLSISGVAAGKTTVTVSYAKEGYATVTRTIPVTVLANGVGWEANFAYVDNWTAGYSSGAVQVDQLNGGADGVRVTLTEQANPIWQPFSTSARVNITDTPILQVRTSNAVGTWTVKIGAPGTDFEQALKLESSEAGIFNYKLTDYGPMSGWTGERELYILFYLIKGEEGAALDINEVRFINQIVLEN